MIQRIKIHGYKSLKDVEIPLKPLSVLFGSNAAGKSNFLDALQLLSRITSSRTLKQAFEPPYRGNPLESFTFGPEGIKGLLKEHSVSFSIEVDVKLSRFIIESVNRQAQLMRSIPTDDGNNTLKSSKKRANYVTEDYLRYKITIEILPDSGFLRVTDEYLTALKKGGTIKAGRNPFIEKKGNRIHVRMEGQAHPLYYDLHLDHSILSLSHYAPHYPHIVALQKEFLNWHFYYFEPREHMRTSSPVKEVRHIGLMGEELSSFLNTLKVSSPGQFRSLEKALNLIVPSVTGIEVSVNDLGEVELRLCEGQKSIPARIVSEGTLRILGLLALWGVTEPPSVIGFEEPENGVHPRRIKLIADLLKNKTMTGETQLVVTTHSPLLTDLIPNENLFICRKAKGETILEPFLTWGDLPKKMDIEKILDEEESAITVSERIMRGDFDA
jgi:predicted ATPase